MNRAKISIDETQLEALNELASTGVFFLSDSDCDTKTTAIANDWLVQARQALVASQDHQAEALQEVPARVDQNRPYRQSRNEVQTELG